MSCLWSSHSVSSCLHFVASSCVFPASSEDNRSGILSVHISVFLYNKRSLRSGLSLRVYSLTNIQTAFQKLCLLRQKILSHSFLLVNMLHNHSCSQAASCGQLCVLQHVSVPPPPWTHVETFWMPKNTKHSSELARVETWHSSEEGWSVFKLVPGTRLQKTHSCLCLPLVVIVQINMHISCKISFLNTL